MSERLPAIFVSYRGSDVTWAADLVYFALSREFGEDAVFKAAMNLRAGDDYPPILEKMAASCPVMVVCIGPHWLKAENADGTRRLDDAHDWVRREIELALKHGNHVLPLLLGNHGQISIPAERELPEDIAALANRQALRLEPGGRLRITMPDLIAQLAERVPGLARHSSSAINALITSRMEIGNVHGKATAVRTTDGTWRPIDASMRIVEVAASGEVTGVEIGPRHYT